MAEKQGSQQDNQTLATYQESSQQDLHWLLREKDKQVLAYQKK